MKYDRRDLRGAIRRDDGEAVAAALRFDPDFVMDESNDAHVRRLILREYRSAALTRAGNRAVTWPLCKQGKRHPLPRRLDVLHMKQWSGEVLIARPKKRGGRATYSQPFLSWRGLKITTGSKRDKTRVVCRAIGAELDRRLVVASSGDRATIDEAIEIDAERRRGQHGYITSGPGGSLCSLALLTGSLKRGDRTFPHVLRDVTRIMGWVSRCGLQSLFPGVSRSDFITGLPQFIHDACSEWLITGEVQP